MPAINVYLSKDLATLLEGEDNRSQLVADLLRQHYGMAIPVRNKVINVTDRGTFDRLQAINAPDTEYRYTPPEEAA